MTKSYERIKNFSTTIAVEKTIAEIERMLSKYGVTKIMKEFDEFGNTSKLFFAVLTEHGEMPVKLPLNIDKVLEVFKIQVSDGKLPQKFWSGEWAVEQAHRVGWRIIKDWLDAQLTILQIGMVKVQEIFLPYAYDARSGQTLFQKMEKKGFAGYIEGKESDIQTIKKVEKTT